MENQLPNTRPTDSVWALLVERIAALESRMDAFEAEVGIGDKADTETACDYMAEHDGWNEPDGTGYAAALDEEVEFSDGCIDGIAAALDEEDPDDFWIGGTDGPDD